MANSYDVTRSPFVQKPQEVVNWGSCTADEILEYEEQGQEVPSAYLSWAEEMSASINKQDNLTYEMAQAQEGSEGNSAEDFRAQLGENDVSLKQQGKIFIEESKAKEATNLDYISQMAPLLNVAQEIDTEAGNVAEQATTQLEALKSQIQALIEDKDDRPEFFQNRERRGEIAGLEAVAKALGTQAEGQLEGLDAELEDVNAIVNRGFAASDLSVDYGTETVEIGAELAGKRSKAGTVIGSVLGFAAAGVLGGVLGGIFGGLFGMSEKRKIGKEALEQGSQTLTVGQQGQEIAEQAAEAHGVSIEAVAKSTNEVKAENQDNPTGENGGDTPEGPTTGATTAEQDTVAKNEQAELDPTLADTSITTDPNEILKRKERKGLA